MEKRIRSWDFVSLTSPIKTDEGIIPAGTIARVIDFYGEDLCKVMLFAPRCHFALVSPENLEFRSSHVAFTQHILSFKDLPTPLMTCLSVTVA